MPRRLCSAILLSVVLALPVWSWVQAADAENIGRAAQMKAAYLFNFLKFVQWPEVAPEASVTACLIGHGEVQRAFISSVDGKKAGGRAVIVRELDPGHDTQGCGMLFIDADAVRAGSQPPPAEPATPVLTVSDASGFIRAGGMIELFTENNRLHFNINVAAARRAGLNISSNLLQLATSVEKVGTL